MNGDRGVEEYERDLKYFEMCKYKYPLRVVFQKRSFHAFCLGTPKSGTHSIASMFKGFRARHEPNAAFMIHLIHKKEKGELYNDDIINILRSRDTTNWLEMESSHYLGEVVEQLVNIYNDAKYILTIRDCLSWMDSWFNHQLSSSTLTNESALSRGRNNYYSKGHEYTKHDRILEKMKLYPIRSYLEFWRTRNQNVINSVADDKLLIIKTHDISKSTYELSKFLNINESQIISKSSHEFKAKVKHGILEKIDANFLHDTAMEICGELNDKYFPEKTITQVLRSYKRL